MNINRINEYNKLLNVNSGHKYKDDSINFTDILKDAIDNVNKMQIESDEYKKMLAFGEVDNLHEVTIASEKANIALQITMSIRNKVVEAYKEIMRIQI
ncbi:MAG: flagellar hook-basal body complex protein FliE [Tissierellia bacterium]|nr:flagellar hook-basal body complex protein FliE [Tissierellia bacterium]